MWEIKDTKDITDEILIWMEENESMGGDLDDYFFTMMDLFVKNHIHKDENQKRDGIIDLKDRIYQMKIVEYADRICFIVFCPVCEMINIQLLPY